MPADASALTPLAQPAWQTHNMTRAELCDSLIRLAETVNNDAPIDRPAAALAVQIRSALGDLIATAPLPEGWRVDEINDQHWQILDAAGESLGHVHSCGAVFQPVLVLRRGGKSRLTLRHQPTREQAVASIVTNALHIRP